MNVRRLYLDDGPGERRGVVTLDGLPERLLIERDEDSPVQQPGVKLAVRVRRIDRTLNAAFLDIGAAPDAVLPLTGPAKAVAEGAWLQVEIVSPPRIGKGAVARWIGVGDGPIRVLTAAPGLNARLSAFAPGAVIDGGEGAREAADIAEDVALRIVHPLAGGGRLFIEPTQALTAIDVDLGAASGESRKAAIHANKDAVAAAARLLRLKGLGGLIAIDLAGKGHDGAALSALAKAAFAPDGEGVSIGPISRFGIFELSLPRAAAPVAERLLEPDGTPSVAAAAFRLLRRIESAAGPGLQVTSVASPAVAEIAARFAPRLIDRIGARFVITPDAARSPADFEVTPR